uniref:Metalloendopeptidase n=1 Tax=Parastrongyloides trichosuri TaxID=131310 RepID=A0A0N4ZM59_PARTI
MLYLYAITFYIFLPKVLLNEVQVFDQEFDSNINDGRNSQIRKARSIKTIQKEKWKFPLKYIVRQFVDNETIDETFKLLTRETCLRFERVNEVRNDEQALEFVHFKACGSFIGNNVGNQSQIVAVDIFCNGILGRIKYLVGYALGLTDQHTREDRYKYVKINFQNIIPRGEKAFQIYYEDIATSYGMQYDFGSLFNYCPRQYSTNSKNTIEPIFEPYLGMMGQKQTYSFNDYKLLNFYYCRELMNPKIVCENGGYSDPNRKNFCKCPHGYRGKRCEELKGSDLSCNDIELTADSKKIKTLKIDGIKNCVYRITAQNGYKIQLELITVNTKKNSVCMKNRGLEVKYREDKGVVGLCLCGFYENIKLKSEIRDVLVLYTGLKEDNKVVIKYKALK